MACGTSTRELCPQFGSVPRRCVSGGSGWRGRRTRGGRPGRAVAAEGPGRRLAGCGPYGGWGPNRSHNPRPRRPHTVEATQVAGGQVDPRVPGARRAVDRTDCSEHVPNLGRFSGGASAPGDAGLPSPKTPAPTRRPQPGPEVPPGTERGTTAPCRGDPRAAPPLPAAVRAAACRLPAIARGRPFATGVISARRTRRNLPTASPSPRAARSVPERPL
jgi:hypothetical protein